MAADSQSEVPTEEAEEIVSTENLPSNIVQTKPCKKKRKYQQVTYYYQVTCY